MHSLVLLPIVAACDDCNGVHVSRAGTCRFVMELMKTGNHALSVLSCYTTPIHLLQNRDAYLEQLRPDGSSIRLTHEADLVLIGEYRVTRR